MRQRGLRRRLLLLAAVLHVGELPNEGPSKWGVKPQVEANIQALQQH